MPNLSRIRFAPTLALAAALLAACSRDADPKAEAPAAAETDTAELAPGVTVEPEMQKRLGIELVPVTSAALHSVAEATAVVLDSQTFATSLDDLAAARSELGASQENADRLQHLYDDGGNASHQALEAARSQVAASHARVTSTEATARATWGSRLIDSADANMRTLRQRLAHGRAALIRAEFSSSLPGDPAVLEYAVTQPAVTAQFIELSRAPAQSTNGAAVTLAVVLDEAQVAPRPGSRLAVTAAVRGGAAQPMVPASGAIADGGQLWCYVLREDNRFERVALDTDKRVGENYPAVGIAAGDRVVVRGAPLLLSLERGAGMTATEEE